MEIVCPPDTVRELTRLSTDDRTPDGRPRVPDALLERLKVVTTEQVWGVLREHGYHHQFEGNWFVTHPDEILVGRGDGGLHPQAARPLRSRAENRCRAGTRRAGWPKLVGH